MFESSGAFFELLDKIAQIPCIFFQMRGSSWSAWDRLSACKQLWSEIRIGPLASKGAKGSRLQSTRPRVNKPKQCPSHLHRVRLLVYLFFALTDARTRGKYLWLLYISSAVTIKLIFMIVWSINYWNLLSRESLSWVTR